MLALEERAKLDAPVNDGSDGLREFRLRMVAERRRRGWSQEELGRRTALSKVSIRKIELGQTSNPKHETVAMIARALNIPSPGVSPNPPPSLLQAAEAVPPMPVYRWGARGDPRHESNDQPNPDLKAYPAGAESLVGPHGFGVIVRGESLAADDIPSGAIAWINPDEPPRAGKLGAVTDGSEGLVVRHITSNDGSSVVGKVVWITPAGRPPP